MNLCVWTALSILVLFASVAAAQSAAPSGAHIGSCDTTYFSNLDCEDPNSPLVFNCCSGDLFWSYPTNKCYIKLVSNCTADGSTVLNVKVDYTANLNKSYMTGSIYEESETKTQGNMRAFLGGGRGSELVTCTTGSAHIRLPSTTAYMTLTAGPKLNLYGVMWSYSFTAPPKN